MINPCLENVATLNREGPFQESQYLKDFYHQEQDRLQVWQVIQDWVLSRNRHLEWAFGYAMEALLVCKTDEDRILTFKKALWHLDRLEQGELPAAKIQFIYNISVFDLMLSWDLSYRHITLIEGFLFLAQGRISVACLKDILKAAVGRERNMLFGLNKLLREGDFKDINDHYDLLAEIRGDFFYFSKRETEKCQGEEKKCRILSLEEGLRKCVDSGFRSFNFYDVIRDWHLDRTYNFECAFKYVVSALKICDRPEDRCLNLHRALAHLDELGPHDLLPTGFGVVNACSPSDFMFSWDLPQSSFTILEGFLFASQGKISVFFLKEILKAALIEEDQRDLVSELDSENVIDLRHVISDRKANRPAKAPKNFGSFFFQDLDVSFIKNKESPLHPHDVMASWGLTSHHNLACAFKYAVVALGKRSGRDLNFNRVLWYLKRFEESQAVIETSVSEKAVLPEDLFLNWDLEPSYCDVIEGFYQVCQKTLSVSSLRKRLSSYVRAEKMVIYKDALLTEAYADEWEDLDADYYQIVRAGILEGMTSEDCP